MYQNLINSLKKILESKSTAQEKLLKISTLVDFADGLDTPLRIPQVPTPPPTPLNPTYTTPITVNAKKPNGPGALVGVEDVK